jgi:hypothetical protein
MTYASAESGVYLRGAIAAFGRSNYQAAQAAALIGILCRLVEDARERREEKAA